MIPFADQLESALVQLIDKPQRLRGQLGFVVRGAYTVLASDSTKYYVRLAAGEVVRASHRSRVPPLPDLDVWVLKLPNGKVVIDDVDWDKAYIKFGAFAATLGVGLHTHARFSGLEFPVATRLLEPLKLTWSGTVFALTPGFYRLNGQLKWWPGDQTLDLASSPFGMADYRWKILAINTTPTPKTLVLAATGSGVDTLADLTLDQLPALVNPLASNLLPVAAVRLRTGTTGFSEHHVESLLDLWEGGLTPASHISYDHATSGLVATTVQAALDELADGLGHVTSHYRQFTYEVVAGAMNFLTDEDGNPLFMLLDTE